MTDLPTDTAELSEADLAIRDVYGMEVNYQQRIHPRDATPQEKSVLRASEAISPIPAIHTPETVRKTLEEAHETFHVGQEVYDPRCPLCVTGPQSEEATPIRLKPAQEQPKDTSKVVTAMPPRSSQVRSRMNTNGGFLATVCQDNKKFRLGVYKDAVQARYAYDVCIRLLGLDLYRLNFPEGCPSGLTDETERAIEEKVRASLTTNKLRLPPSGFKGVYWSSTSQRWVSCVHRRGQTFHLGCFVDKVEAAILYDAKVTELDGPNAVTNKSLGLIPPQEAKRNEPTPAEPKRNPSTLGMGADLRRDSTTGMKGVSWHRGTKKYQVSICKDRQQFNLGYFSDLLDAAKAYDQKARELFGDHAALNFPSEANPVFAPPSPSEPQSQEAPAPVSETVGPPLSS
jgi:hypothetical protein